MIYVGKGEMMKPHRFENGGASSCANTQDIENKIPMSIKNNMEAFKPFNPQLSRKLDAALLLVEHESDPRWVELLCQYHGFLAQKLVTNDTI